MFSLSVGEPVRFRCRKGSPLTALPVSVEFGRMERKIVSSGDWRRLNAGDGDSRQVASPSELLHAVAALYSRCLPDLTVQSLYRTVCAEGAKTLLLLRDTSEILQEWESHHLPSSASQSREDSLGEINNNPALKTEGKGGNTDDRSDIVTSPGPSPHSTPDKETSANDHHWPAKTDNVHLTEGHLESEWKPWIPKNNNNYLERFRPFRTDECPDNAASVPRMRQPDNGQVENVESPFSDVFSDSGDGSDTGSAMEEEDETEDFSRGLEAFLRAVASRRQERRVALERHSLFSTHVGIEHRLVAAATFNKNYRIPGTRIVYLSLLTVRKRFRKCGIGKFMLKKLKSPSQVGPYDALVVRADTSALAFFLRHCFTDDLILNSRFRELEFEGSPKGTLLSYLPPFDGHYPPLPGAQDWNSMDAMVAMDEEIEKWRQKSLESYQTQVTCLTRLQQEVLRLHNLLRRQDVTIQFLKKENQRLQGRLTKVERKSAQALIDVLEKEASDFENFCNIQYQSNEDR